MEVVVGLGIRTRMTLASRAAALAVVLSAVAPASAHADMWCWLFGSCGGSSHASQQTSPNRSTPEIDPGALASAIALAVGGAALLSDRVRRRR